MRVTDDGREGYRQFSTNNTQGQREKIKKNLFVAWQLQSGATFPHPLARVSGPMYR